MKDPQLDSDKALFLPAPIIASEVKTIPYESRPSEEGVLSLILLSLRKYWYVSLSISSLMMAFITYRTLTETRIYKSEIQIVIELKESSGLAEKIAASTGGGLSDERTTTIETITQTLKSRSIIREAINNITDQTLKPSVAKDSGNPVDLILKNLTIKSGEKTNILTVSYTDSNPQRIVATLDALAAAYIDYSIKTKKARTDKSISFIEAQLPESRRRLERSAEEVKQFRLKYRFVDPESSSISLSNYRQEIYQKLDQAKVQFDQTQKQYKELNKQLLEVGISPQNSLSTTVLIQDSVYQDLFKKFNDLDIAYSQERLRFSDENPYAISAKQKRDEMLLSLKSRAQEVLKRNVSEAELTNKTISGSNSSNSLAQSLAIKLSETETSLAAQKVEYESLSKVYAQIESQFSQLPILQKQYTELQRQYSIYSQELTAFLQKLQELRLADAEQLIPWKLLDPPELPQEPISPVVPRQLGLGALFSLLVGILAAVGLKKLDNGIDNPETVKSIAGIPILSLIPNVDDFENELVWRTRFLQPVKQNRNRNENYSYWSFVEAIRTLALGIRLTTDRENAELGKVIALTSALPKEGKSTITFNTSVALSELGYRVLLVDVDLHKSTITKMCRNSGLFASNEANKSGGLADVLLKGDRWEDLIFHSLELKLDVLFSGSQSINSITLLNSPRFKRLIDHWKQEYDYVIFDTPPVVGVSDTSLIGSLVDGIVYIVSLNVAQKHLIERALEIISAIKVPILGLVINRVDNHYSNYSKYYQYYQKSDELSRAPIPTQVIEGKSKDI